jgi:hypothetical protein
MRTSEKGYPQITQIDADFEDKRAEKSFGRDYRMKRIQRVEDTVVFTLCILFIL